ncbi:MAG: F0F1 ATP synthase subunit alpha [Methanothrix sp.]|jgi:F-type H+-transporting ATPase subunit alpha|uniref:F0F1 ATP synthase subunit alpha n=1 Tax=Methanothrix sp. TaxID=90426 RepID=UPI0025FCBD4D|nr:F0F1 ATP synthase subunit alpha [Methanothrix sp.]MCK9405885.1 F0F1 ATP synthase subunit alpha [Methanothrix sp.]MCK9565278.1 F0F1 ATP synthase subunit alpha [Methanothrix sp.]
MKKDASGIREVLADTFAAIEQNIRVYRPELKIEEIGMVTFVGKGVVRIKGLPNAGSEELIRFPGDNYGMVFNLDPEEVAVIMLSKSENIKAKQIARRTGSIMEVPVGEELLGRVVDCMGRPLDEGGSIQTMQLMPIEREAPSIMERAAVNVPLQTGTMVVDSMIPIGRGQRELILGDRQTGKTSMAIDTIINQRDKDVICIYCSIGQEKSEVALVEAELRKNDAMENCIIVAATGEDPPAMNFIAPYAATTMAEFFAEKGHDVLIVYDDLTRHARAYRELSLLLRRPPGREAFPGDIFYIHSRLLERATHYRNGGSLTALPIIETQAQDISAYIPTNLISITDGQIYLSPELFRKGILPAVDVGLSVSRVGGKSQLPAFAEVAGPLRLAYSQFEGLEVYTRFGTRLDEETQKILQRGRRIREVLKQSQFDPMPAPEQIAIILAATEGILDEHHLEEIASAKIKMARAFREKLPRLNELMASGQKLSHEDRELILKTFTEILQI